MGESYSSFRLLTALPSGRWGAQLWPMPRFGGLGKSLVELQFTAYQQAKSVARTTAPVGGEVKAYGVGSASL